jgi:hypothetical protein
MNRRNFFKMFGGAIAAAMLPLGALALSERKRFELSDAEFWAQHRMLSLDDFEDRILNPAVRRMAENLDTEIMRIMK